jgi:glucose dehydrogenase
MNRRLFSAALALCAATAWTTGPGAQAKRKVDWLTDGGDPQRTAWQRDETILTKDNINDMKLLWKIQTDNQPRQMHNLFPPLVAGNVATASGDKEIAVLAGVSDNVYGIDVATGQQIWKRKFDSTFPDAAGGRGGGVLCPGGLTATPVLEERTPGKYVAYAVSWRLR